MEASYREAGWFFSCMTRLFLPLSRLWCWVVDGSFFRLPCCQVQCEGGSGTPAYGDGRPSRAKPEWMHVVCTDPPAKRVGQNSSGFISPGRTGARTRSRPRAKRARLSASLVRGWIFWMLKGIRKIPVHKTWTKHVVDRDWFRVPAGTPGPDGLKACVSLCQMLHPGQKVKGFTPKKRHQAAWTFGKFLSKVLVKKLLDY